MHNRWRELGHTNKKRLDSEAQTDEKLWMDTRQSQDGGQAGAGGGQAQRGRRNSSCWRYSDQYGPKLAAHTSSFPVRHRRQITLKVQFIKKQNTEEHRGKIKLAF